MWFLDVVKDLWYDILRDDSKYRVFEKSVRCCIFSSTYHGRNIKLIPYAWYHMAHLIIWSLSDRHFLYSEFRYCNNKTPRNLYVQPLLFLWFLVNTQCSEHESLKIHITLLVLQEFINWITATWILPEFRSEFRYNSGRSRGKFCWISIIWNIVII